MKLHSLGFGITALDEPRATIDVHQAPVVIIIDCGAQEAHVEQLTACVVYILGEQGEKLEKVSMDRGRYKWSFSLTTDREITTRGLQMILILIATDKKDTLLYHNPVKYLAYRQNENEKKCFMRYNVV